MCGVNAQCQVVNHNPICSCYNGYTGDPFVRCFYDESKFKFILRYCYDVCYYYIMSRSTNTYFYQGLWNL